MLAAVPSLRAFAISLCGDVDRANDLVQETLMRAWSHLDSFEPGTNMSAWLFTILRNHFRTEYRKRRREVEDADGGYAERLTTPEEQTAHIQFGELRQALGVLEARGRGEAGEAVGLLGGGERRGGDRGEGEGGEESHGHQSPSGSGRVQVTVPLQERVNRRGRGGRGGLQRQQH